MKKKSLFVTIILLLIAIFAFSLTACDKEVTTLKSLQNEYGIVVDGGSFEEGSTLVSNEIVATTEEAAEVLTAIADQNYNKDGNVYIFDIYVTKDGKEVQPSGKVTVSIPVPNVQVDNYLVFHIKADNSVENLVPTVADGKISFETSSFSYFVITETAPEHVHSFGGWMQDTTNEKKHIRECNCGEIETADCTFDNGVVTQEPSHFEEGVKTYTCTVCGRTKEESIDKTDNHSFGGWYPSEESEDKHERACNCGEKETGDCTFDDGVVTKEPTHFEEGIKTYTCTVCSRTKTESVPTMTEHSFGDWGLDPQNEDKHIRECKCGEIETGDCTFDDGVVTQEPTHFEEGIRTYTCTVCGRTKEESIDKTNEHSYGDMYYERSPSFWEDGNIAYYHCEPCGKYFDEEYNEVETPVIPKYSTNLSICVNGVPTALVIGEQHENFIEWSLEGLSVTKGDVITICQTDNREFSHNYFAEGNVDADGKILTTAAAANVLLTATPNGLMLFIDGYKYEGIVIEINGVQHPMNFVTYPDGETTSYVYGYVNFAVNDKFVIVDNVSGTVYDYDDLDEEFLWDTWDFHRGENGEFVIDFAARYGIEFDNNGNKKIYISKAFAPYDGESFGVVFEGDREDEIFDSMELPTDEGADNEFMWTLTHCTTMNNADFVEYIGENGLWFYYTIIDIEEGEKFSLKNFTTGELIGADYLVDITGDFTAVTREGDLVSVEKSGSFYIIYLPAFNSFTIDCDTSDPLAEIILAAGDKTITLTPDEKGDVAYEGFESKTYHIITLYDSKYSSLPIILDESMDKTLVDLTVSEGTYYAYPTKEGVYNLRYNVHTNILYLEYVGGTGSGENPTDSYLYSLLTTNSNSDNQTLSMEINPDNSNEVCYKGANISASYFISVMEIAKDGSASNTYGALADTDASIAQSYGTIAMVKIGGTYDVYFDTVEKTIRLVPASGSDEEEALPKDIYIDETEIYALVENAENADELCYLGLALESYDAFRIRDTKDSFLADLTLSAGTTGAQSIGAAIMVENDGTYNIYINKTTHEVRIELAPSGDCAEGACVYDEGVVTKEPTHLEEGTRTLTCTVCGKTKEEPIAKTSGHEFGDWMPNKTNPGKHYRECACGEVETGDCEFDEGVVTKEPTHLEEGVRTFTCTVCKGAKEEPIDKTGDHSFGDWKPDELDETKHYKQCDCGEVETGDCTFEDGSCTVCGREKAEEIDGIIIVVAGGSATFEDKETATTYSNIYGENANVYVAQENDVLNVKLTDQEGRTFKYWASATGTIIPDEDFSMLVFRSGYYYPVFEDTDANAFSSRVKIYEGNCEEGILYMSTNSKGDVKYEIEYVNYGRHAFDEMVDYNNQYHKQECLICGEDIFEAHTDYSREVEKEPTHTEEGLMKCECYCGHVWTEPIPVTDEHTIDYDNWDIVEESKNGQYGKYRVYCKYCDYYEEYWYLGGLDFVSFIDGKMINYQYTYGGKVSHDEYYYSYRNAEGKKVYIWALQYEYETSSNKDNNDTYIFMYIDDEDSTTIEPIYLSKSRGDRRAEYLWAIYGYAYDVNGWIETLDYPDDNMGCGNGMVLGNSMSARASVFESYHDYWAETYNKLRIPTSKEYNDLSDTPWEIDYEGKSFQGGYYDENDKYVMTGGRDTISFVKDPEESYKKYMYVDKETGITYGYADYGTYYRTSFMMRTCKAIVSPEEFENLDAAGQSVHYSYGDIEKDIKSLCSKRTLFNNFTLTVPETITAFRLLFSDSFDCVDISGDNTDVYSNTAHVYNSGSPIAFTWNGKEGIVFDRYEIWDFAKQEWVLLSQEANYTFNTLDNPRRTAAYVRVICHEVEVPVEPGETFRISVENGYFEIDGEVHYGAVEVPVNTHVYVYANDVDGKTFEYWLDGNGAEFNNYHFYVTSDITLTPVYTDTIYGVYCQGWNYDSYISIDGGEMHYTDELKGKAGDTFELNTSAIPDGECTVFLGWYMEVYGLNGSEYVLISDSQSFTYEITGEEQGWLYAVWTTGENPFVKKFVDIRVTNGFVSYAGGEASENFDNAYSAISLSSMGRVAFYDDPADETVYTAWDIAYRYELEGEVQHEIAESYEDEYGYYPAGYWVDNPEYSYPDGVINVTATIVSNDDAEEGEAVVLPE